MAWGMLKKFQTMRSARELKKTKARAVRMEEKAEFARQLEKDLERERVARVDVERVRLMKDEVAEQRRAPVKRVLSGISGRVREMNQREGGVFASQGERKDLFAPAKKSPFMEDDEEVF